MFSTFVGKSSQVPYPSVVGIVNAVKIQVPRVSVLHSTATVGAYGIYSWSVGCGGMKFAYVEVNVIHVWEEIRRKRARRRRTEGRTWPVRVLQICLVLASVHASQGLHGPRIRDSICQRSGKILTVCVGEMVTAVFTSPKSTAISRTPWP